MEQYISRLINSVLFFLPYVLVIKEEEKTFRLVVARDDQIMMDQRYKTLRGARIAFSKLFKDYRYSNKIKAHWSHFYPPGEIWLQARLNCENTPLSKSKKKQEHSHDKNLQIGYRI